LLKEMQRRNQQMAIVVDEHGSVAGIVTVEDLVEEIIGEIARTIACPPPTLFANLMEAWCCAGVCLSKGAGVVRRGMGCHW